MTILEIVLFAAGIIVIPVSSAIIGFLVWKQRSDREKQAKFEAKLKEMLTERNRHLSKLVESLLYENVEIIKEEISESEYTEGMARAADVVGEMKKTLELLEREEGSSSIAGMTMLQAKLQSMVDNLDEQIVAREETKQDDRDYKTLN